MRRVILIVALFFCAVGAKAQELYVFTEPASNMPAKSMGIRLSNWLMDETAGNRINYHLIPELMWGVNKHLMLHAEGYLSNRTNRFKLEGAALYGKYRFFNRDAVFRHFRAAGFARISTNNSGIHQEEIETNGHNTGIEAGLVATELLHTRALSTTVSYERALNNRGGHDFPAYYSNNAMNYSLSFGQLIFPRSYTGYKQVNVNVLVELLGQSLLDNGKAYLDVAPALQVIVNSQVRIDVGYKRQLYSSIARTAPNGFMVRFEYLLFNVL